MQFPSFSHLGVVCSIPCLSLAEKDNSTTSSSIVFQNVDKFPDGVVPMIFASIEDAKTYIDSMQRDLKSASLSGSSSIANEQNNVVMSSGNGGMVTGRVVAANYVGGVAWVNVAVTAHGWPSLDIIVADGAPYSWISGVVIGMTWIQDAASIQNIQRSDYSQYIKVRTWGHINFYLVINGGILLYTSNWSFMNDFHASQIA
jgi:hypothetical protein